MNCTEAQDLLSPFYDNELSDERRVQVEEHVASCTRCAEELAGFESLTMMAGGLSQPAPPDLIWNRLESALDEQPAPRARGATAIWWKSKTRVLALAATLLMAIGLTWWGHGMWFGDDSHHEMADVFGRYLDQFHNTPVDAQQMLVAMYDGQAIDPGQALHLVGYRPATANPLPAGYNAQATYVLKMPCCTCVQTVCQRQDGSTIAIFEHDDENREWMGDRRMEMADCDGKQCRLCNINDRLAVTWQRGSRQITMIGLRDTEEVGKLIAWLDQSPEEEPS